MSFGSRSRVFRWALVCFVLAATGLPAIDGYAQLESDKLNVGDMTPRQRLVYAQDAVEEVREGTRKVTKAVEAAQRAKDVLLLNCLNEKLAGLKSLSTVVESADKAMQEALAKENYDLATHELQKMVIARQQAQQLMAEAEACVPEVGTSYAGAGRWSSTRPEDQEDDDQYNVDPSGYERPPEASPFT